MSQDSLKIAFFHPDLGIGGAERLVVDAGIALQGYHHDITFYTSYHNPERCFRETADGTLNVFVEGMQWPRAFFGGIGHVFWAIWRMIWCVLQVMISIRSIEKRKNEKKYKLRDSNTERILSFFNICMNILNFFWQLVLYVFGIFFPQEIRIAHSMDAPATGYDVYIIDQIPIAVVLLKLFAPLKPNGEKPLIIFYCHFPDKLLAQNRNSLNPLRRLYRFFFDSLEEWSMKHSDIILVNSKFTQNIFKESFKSIRIVPQVLYPSISEESYDVIPSNIEESKIYPLLQKKKHIVVSINRFERKKNHILALESFIELKNLLPDFSQKCHLVIAGGYDPRLKENVDVKSEIESLAKKHQIESNLTLLPSFNEVDRFLLLHKCNIILYTPENEHFGIVPLEAMYCKRPIIAVNSGGPKESIKDGETGFLCPNDSRIFARKIAELLSDRKLAESMGESGHRRVKKLFSFQVFASQLNDYVHQSQKPKSD